MKKTILLFILSTILFLASCSNADPYLKVSQIGVSYSVDVFAGSENAFHFVGIQIKDTDGNLIDITQLQLDENGCGQCEINIRVEEFTVFATTDGYTMQTKVSGR